jgi:dTDP-glucose 4,6-dehydratase
MNSRGPAVTPRHLLVTGGAGFIGANFIHRLIAREPSVRVVNLDRLTYAGSLAKLDGLADPSRHTFVEGDICDRALVDRLLREHAIDTVVHFAAESHVDRSISGPGEFVRTNVIGTFTLLEAARDFWLGEQGLRGETLHGARRFHHISTDEVFGTLGEKDPAFRETTPYAPNSPYSASKAASDHFVRAWYHTYGLPVTTSNCSNNYGPRQHPEKLIPTIIRSCVEGTPIPVYGDGRNIRDWLFVDDHCDAIWQVLCRGTLGETYNVGGENEQRNIEIVRAICALMDTRRPQAAPHERLISFVTDRPGHDWRYSVDTAFIARELGWRPASRYTEALAVTVDWYLADSSRLAP